jgi:phosphate transport system permease protein
MALLTLPVVIVSTEEGLARVPAALREGSLALGATRAETLWRVVVPAASPAVLTGLILAIARATGEVAPLILVGVAKYAPGLPVSTEAPFLHLDRQFMHLGFYIYDLGFQSPYLQTVEGLVFATALLLVLIVLLLNIAAVMLRSRLRDAFKPEEMF